MSRSHEAAENVMAVTYRNGLEVTVTVVLGAGEDEWEEWEEVMFGIYMT